MDVVSKARELAPSAIQLLSNIVKGLTYTCAKCGHTEPGGPLGKEARTQVLAAREILDRAYGRAPIKVDLAASILSISSSPTELAHVAAAILERRLTQGRLELPNGQDSPTQLEAQYRKEMPDLTHPPKPPE